MFKRIVQLSVVALLAGMVVAAPASAVIGQVGSIEMGISGGHLSADHSSAGTGDLEIVTLIKSQDYSSGQDQVIVSKWESSEASKKGFRLLFNGSGDMVLEVADTGSTVHTYTIDDADLGMVDGWAYWIRAQWDKNTDDPGSDSALRVWAEVGFGYNQGVADPRGDISWDPARTSNTDSSFTRANPNTNWLIAAQQGAGGSESHFQSDVGYLAVYRNLAGNSPAIEIDFRDADDLENDPDFTQWRDQTSELWTTQSGADWNPDASYSPPGGGETIVTVNSGPTSEGNTANLLQVENGVSGMDVDPRDTVIAWFVTDHDHLDETGSDYQLFAVNMVSRSVLAKYELNNTGIGNDHEAIAIFQDGNNTYGAIWARATSKVAIFDLPEVDAGQSLVVGTGLAPEDVWTPSGSTSWGNVETMIYDIVNDQMVWVTPRGQGYDLNDNERTIRVADNWTAEYDSGTGSAAAVGSVVTRPLGSGVPNAHGDGAFLYCTDGQGEPTGTGAMLLAGAASSGGTPNDYLMVWTWDSAGDISTADFDGEFPTDELGQSGATAEHAAFDYALGRVFSGGEGAPGSNAGKTFLTEITVDCS